MSSKEQTLSIIKPDAVERNLSEKIGLVSKNNLSILETKKLHISKEEALNFTKFISLNLFMINCVDTYLLDQLKL